MREIKFRVWDLLLKDYTYDAQSHFLWDCFVNLSERYCLEQYTGLKDKNGVEIYEGDIVMTYPDEHGVSQVKLVEFSDDRFELGVTTNGRSGAILCKNNQGILLVIGNIQQNPELLRD